MCGIAGILDSTSKRPPQSDELSAMQLTMRHRGPDGGGQWISPKGNVGLAHLRLSIIDLSEKEFFESYNHHIKNKTQLFREQFSFLSEKILKIIN